MPPLPLYLVLMLQPVGNNNISGTGINKKCTQVINCFDTCTTAFHFDNQNFSLRYFPSKGVRCREEKKKERRKVIPGLVGVAFVYFNASQRQTEGETESMTAARERWTLIKAESAEGG